MDNVAAEKNAAMPRPKRKSRTKLERRKIVEERSYLERRSSRSPVFTASDQTRCIIGGACTGRACSGRQQRRL